MNLLAAALYDPAVAVTKNTTAALAMTAIDTTNLRLAVTVPAHGKVRFRLSAVIHGATTFPSILLGVMVGAVVKGRVAPAQVLGNTAVATALLQVLAEFTVTGLTAGATNFDAAYGVETLVAATGLKYGGPDNATANDAFGAFVFEAWDPQPITANNQISVDANGRVDVIKVVGTTQTARDLGAQLDAAISTRASSAALATVQADTDDIQTRLPATLVSGRMDASVGAMAANVMTAAAAASDLTTELQAGLATSAALATVQADTDDIQTRLPVALVGGRISADVGSLGGTVQSATDLKDFADTGYDPVLHLTSATAVVSAPVSLVAAYDAAKTAAQAGNAMALTVAERASVADKLLGRTRAGGADGGRTVSECLAFGRNRWAVVAGVLTVYADDGATPLYTAVVTTQSSNPVNSVTPS